MGGDGVPVIVFHGMGSSRFTWCGAPLVQTCPGFRLIAVDRPGYGDSTSPPACYSYTAFVKDMEELADFLGLPKFCVAGHSSGGPYALATAALLPERVVACASISSDPPYLHPRASFELRVSDSMSKAKADGGFYGQDLAEAVEDMRARSLQKGDEHKSYAWRQGIHGFVCDFTLERTPWSFRLEDIQLGRALTFWYGSKDFPPMIVGAPFMQGLVPGSLLREVPDGTHGFKSNVEHLRAILEELRVHWDQACILSSDS